MLTGDWSVQRPESTGRFKRKLDLLVPEPSAERHNPQQGTLQACSFHIEKVKENKKNQKGFLCAV